MWYFFASCRSLSQAPSTFVCAPAVALIFSSTGEVEIFGKNKKCNQKIVEFPAFGGQGRTIDLLEDQLVLLHENKLDGRFQYQSIHQPRKGLLGMKFTIENSPLENSPYFHTNTVWNVVNPHWKNGSQISQFAEGACKVKLSRDIFLLIGGFKRVNRSKVEMNSVIRLKVHENTVEELPSIKQSRAFHACEVSGRRILVSGGSQGQVTVSDEVYSLDTNESMVLDRTSSLGRYGHSLLRLEEVIFAFGGLLSNGSETSEVEWFDWSDLSWKKHGESLHSKNTSNIAVTSFPVSAVDCHAGCKCGLTESQVV